MLPLKDRHGYLQKRHRFTFEVMVELVWIGRKGIKKFSAIHHH